MAQAVKILAIHHLTHDVLKIIAEKPAGLKYIPGQAVDISLSKQGWQDEKRPFTFTSLPQDENIEFTIKTYPDHKGVTNQLLSSTNGDELIIHDVFGDIRYQGEGIFIAGGAGITPFISILKELESKNQVGNNKLIFANKTRADIILEDKFQKLLGNNFVNILSEEKHAGYEFGYLTADLIKKHAGNKTKYFYLCGPEPMMQSVEKHLAALGISASSLIKEAF